MKKLYLALAVLASSFGFAQESDSGKKYNLSVFGSFVELQQIGVSLEMTPSKEKKEGLMSKHTQIFSVAYGMMDYEVGGFTSEGTGYTIDLGSRYYFSKPNSGLYYGNNFSYGRICFEEMDVEGTYEYISFFSPEIGYKLMLADQISIDGFAGYMWKIEIRGGGFIDNRNVDNWTPRVGIKLGYQF